MVVYSNYQGGRKGDGGRMTVVSESELKFICPIHGIPAENPVKFGNSYLQPHRVTLYKHVRKALCWGCRKWYQFNEGQWIEIPAPKRKSNAFDLTGIKFGRWTCLYLDKDSNYVRRWICKCDCGTEKSVLQGALRKGSSKSCGCLSKAIVKQRRKQVNTVKLERFVKLAKSSGIDRNDAIRLHRKLKRLKNITVVI